MHENIAVVFQRAEEILAELEGDYRHALKKKEVSARTKQLCHDLFEKLRSGLDRSARRYFELHVSPSLSPEDREAAAIYFPVATDEHAFSSIMGRWRWKSVKDKHAGLAGYLLSLQPFINSDNRWLEILNNLSNEGKHIDLAPQTRREERQVTVSRPGGGSVSYGPGVTFGGGVSIMGVPIDPRTQRVMPNSVLTENIVVWVDFTFEKHGVSAITFAREALAKSKAIAQEMSSTFQI
ncbi:hypothetical protein G8E10_17625 [Rhizobiaceae bacterium CRRU44]|uniref:Uncharacterized protein n=1 Tax=Ferranicluibacter rubi TaxID=2715133 RepID=A0AA44CDY0_9HYPH|nr:hypothetical protein [Ferranicluibacter rubi]NHT77537.1 hypothetical protein [Ferranicluibacter rubi]